MPKVSRTINKVDPYQAITPRRALRESGVNGEGKVARQANPNCGLAQYVYQKKPMGSSNWSGQDCKDLDKVKIFSTIGEDIEPLPPSDPNYNLNNNPDYRYQTCAKVACDTGRNIVVNVRGDINNPEFDNRCCVSEPPQSWTQLPSIDRTRPIFSTNRCASYDNLNHTVSYDLIGCSSNAHVYEVPNVTDSSYCYKGQSNQTVAIDIQHRVGLIPDGNTTAPTITPSKIINPPSACRESSSSAVAVITSAVAGAASTIGAFITPTPTAVIAASASNATVTGLAAGLGITGSGIVIGGAVYGAYKVSQWFKSDPPVSFSMGTIENAQRYVISEVER